MIQLDIKLVIILLAFIILLSIIILMIWKKKDKIDPLVQKGELGELYLYQCLQDLPGPKRMLYHVYLPTNDGETTEIDLLMIHGTGIYVFESKNYTGLIKGRERKPNWYQFIGEKKKRTFYNPIMQNAGHIRALQKVLKGYADYRDYFSMIVFGDYCRIGRIRVKAPNVYVLNRRDINEVCYRMMRRGHRYYDEDQIEQIYEILLRYINVKKNVKKKHVEDLKRRFGS